MLTADVGGILVGGGSRNPVGEEREYKERWVEMNRNE